MSWKNIGAVFGGFTGWFLGGKLDKMGPKPISSEESRFGALQVQTSSFGVVVPILFGKTRIAGNLIWYGDFTAIPHTETQSSGGKGGGGQTFQSTTYTYQTAFAMGLCEGVVLDIPTVWASKSKSTLAALGLTLFTGTDPQTPWGYLTTYHAGQDLGYQGLAYVAHGSYQLGGSASLPNFSFEVIGQSPYDHAGGNDDAAPNVIVNSLLTNTSYGANFPASKIGSLTSYMQYCVANGIFLSPAYSDQNSAAEIIQDLMMITNTGVVWSEGLLKFIPYGDEAVTGNGQTYTPNLTPQYNLTDDDFLWDDDGVPVEAVRKTTADAYNQVQLEFRNRDNEYNIEPVDAKDQASIDMFGLRPSKIIRAHAICKKSVARFVAQLLLQRMLYFRNQYRFSLGWKFSRLEPMDLVTITDAALGLNNTLVRILEIEENEDGNLSFLVEEFPFGIAGAAIYPSQTVGGYSANYNVGAGNVSVPVIFNAPGILSVTGYEIWIAVGSQNADYGGCEIWASTDNTTFKQVGTLFGSSRYGSLTAVLPDSADPDITNACSVDLTISQGELLGGTAQDANLLNTISLVGSELISFQDATLTAAYKYDLETLLRRGVYNSPHSSHPIGEKFARLDQAIFKFPYDPSVVTPGQTIYFKFLSFNRWTAGKQLLSDVSSYSYIVGSSLSAPSNVTGFTVSQNGNVAVFQWDIIPVLQEPNISGYEIRFNPIGDSNWNNGSELTKVTRGTQVTTAKVPPGVWNFMICARDDSGIYSRTPAEFVMEMVNTNTIITAPSQDSDWLGTLSNFVRHCSGVLIPESTKAANQLTKEELWEQFVPYPAAICTYTTPEIDVGFDSEVRLHGEIISLLGRGVTTGIAAPYLELDYRLAAGSYDGFEDWTIGYVTCRYFKMKLTLETAIGNAYIKEFNPVADSGDKAEEILGQVIAAGGTTVSFPIQYHNKPNVQVTVLGTTGLTATIDPATITTTSCKIHVFNSSGTDVGGTVNISIVGV